LDMETLTIREAAERCGLSYQAIRKKVDRGTIRVVKHDGVRRIPRVELERVGLWPGARMGDAPELAALREETERLRRELASNRQLTERAQAAADVERQARERTEQELHRERAERLSGEQRLQLLADASWWERRRILRELRAAQAA
jgi:excisionase family DNA binding protein